MQLPVDLPSDEWNLSPGQQTVWLNGSKFRDAAMRVDGSLDPVREPHNGPELGLLGSILEVSDPVLGITPVTVRDELLTVERTVVCLLLCARQLLVFHLFKANDLATRTVHQAPRDVQIRE